MIEQNPEPKLMLGSVIVTQGASATLPNRVILEALLNHQRGIWGNYLPDDHVDFGSGHYPPGKEVIGFYTDQQKLPFMIVTQANRSRTTVLTVYEYFFFSPDPNCFVSPLAGVSKGDI